MLPSISVVMGVYNDAASVPAAVESIRAQTLTDWELILVNDGSTDRTTSLLDRLAASDRRISVIHQANAGLTQALIRGCVQARGTFIARQDADDVSDPRRFERQRALLESHPDVGIVSCWAQYVGPENEPLEVVTRPANPAEATALLVDDHQGLPAHGTAMYRRSLYEAVGGYRPEFYFSQDIDLWLRMTERAQLAYVAEPLYRYRRCAAGISGTQAATQAEFGRLAFASRAARDRGESDALLLQQAAGLAASIRETRQTGRSGARPAPEMLYIIGTQLARNGDPRAASYLWSIVRRRPWHWRAWARLLQSQIGRRAVSPEQVSPT
ncbi:MAG: glycosyltransferase family 2 protein [Planctomycetaceae bacterium]|nr:glycosyltransferase family 2 protein [Planctomycetaceae bacterium]